MQVIEARIAVAEESRSIAQLARRYGVARRTVRDAVTGRLFGHLDNVAAPVQRQQSTAQGTPAGRTRWLTGNSTLDDTDRAALTAFATEMIAAGAGTDEVAVDLGLTPGLLANLLGHPGRRPHHAAGGARLSVPLVIELRQRVRGGETIQQLSRSTGIPAPTIGAAVRGTTWASVDETEPRVPGRSHTGAGSPVAKLTPQLVGDMRRRVRGGEPIRAIAAQIGVSPTSVNNAVNGNRWPDVYEPPVRQRHFTRTDRDPADKAALVALAKAMTDGGCSYIDAARDLNVSHHSLRSWTTRR